MKRFIALLIAIALAGLQGSAQQLPRTGWLSLFNGHDLAGWDVYLGPPHDSSGKKLSAVPIGLNNDPARVFSIVKEDGENVIRVSGEEIGGISTTQEFAGYHLQVLFKWGNWLHPGRRKKDSGLLYHAVGPHGADAQAWMRSQEFQIEEGNCGDYWGCAGGMAEVPAIKISDSEYVYSAAGKRFWFSADSTAGRHCKKAGDAEKAVGQWNTLDLYCHGDTSMHVVNGQVMMVLYHNRQKGEHQAVALTRGKIQLQSEGAEVFYKNIRIRAIDRLPM
jgi:hypothetical protein